MFKIKNIFYFLLCICIATKVHSVEYISPTSEFHEKNLPQNRYDLHVKLGGYISWGYLADYYSIVSPYIGLAWKGPQLERNWYAEFEIGYLFMEGRYNNAVVESHTIPITISLVRPIVYDNRLEFNPKLGFGYMMLYSYSTLDMSKSGITNFFVFKSALELIYNFDSKWGFILDNALIISFEDKISYYYIPSLGFCYHF